MKDPAPSDQAVPIRIRALDGRPIHLRPGTTDIDVIADDFVFRYQLPPEEIRSNELRRIWELGTNVVSGWWTSPCATRPPS